MRFPALLLLGVCAAAPCCRAVLIETGQTYVWNFTLRAGGTPHAGATFSADNRLDPGEHLRLAFYENSVTETPLLIQDIESTGAGTNGFFFLGFADHGFFQDQQGIFTVTMIEGSLILNNLSVSTTIGGANYYAAVTVPVIPEPAAAAPGIALACLGLALLRRHGGVAGARRRLPLLSRFRRAL